MKMKQFLKSVLLVAAVAMSTTNGFAQASFKIDLGDLASGTEFDGGGLCALMSESFLESPQGQSLITRLTEVRQGAAYADVVNEATKGLESLKNGRKQYAGNTDETSIALLQEIDERISQYEDIIRQYSNGGSALNANDLLKEAATHSAGGRLYYGAEDIGHGYWAVCITPEVKSANSKWGVIDCEGRQIVPCKYNYLENYPELEMLHTFDFSGDYTEGIIRYDGSVVLDCKYSHVNSAMTSFVVIDNTPSGSKWGVADLDGHMLIPQNYAEIEPFVYNLSSGSYYFYVITDGTSGLKAVFDHHGKQVTGFIYDGWLNEAPYFIGVKSAGTNDVFDARTWTRTEIPDDYWNHRWEE